MLRQRVERPASPARTRLGVSGNSSNQTPVASCTAAIDGRGIGDVGHLGHARAPQRAERIGQLEDHASDPGRDVADAGDQVAAQAGIADPAVVTTQVLAQRVAVGLDHRALDLALDEARVDGPADVVGRDHAIDPDVAGADVDGDVDAWAM